MWFWSLVISMTVLISSVCVVVVMRLCKRRKIMALTPFNIVFAGVFLSVLICVVPIFLTVFSKEPTRVLKAIAFSIHHTFQIFTINADRNVILENITCRDPRISAVYSAYLSVIYVAAPILTFGFLMSFVKDFSAFFGYVFRFYRDIYIFSDLNEKSVSLGADIRKNDKRSLIVYTDVFEKNDEQSFELLERAKDLRAICFKKDILAIDLNFHSKKTKAFIFLMGKDETENTNQALRLIDLYRQRDKTELYVFATKIESELLLTKADRGKLKVRRVNEVRSLINRILYENGSEIFKNAKLMPDGDRKISAVIVGMGNHGTEMLKALSWFCQMDGYHVEINAFDADEKAEDRFKALAPELMSEDLNNKFIAGEAEYSIKIHSDFDVTTKKFADKISELTDATYVFISLGSDEMNIRTAVYLRMLFKRKNIKPTIQAVLTDTEEKSALTGIENLSEQKYDIEYVGDNDTSYSKRVIMNSELEAEALARHLKWGSEESFWQYEYNYNSSVALAIHLKARVDCGIPGAEKAEEEWTDEEKMIIEPLEHRRWNAYMRCEGYVFSGSTDENSRNDLAKMHPDLVSYNKLPDEEKRKDSRIVSK